MKPDPGKKRDKARLDDKKSKKAAAKAARKAASSTEAESSAWEGQLRSLRGANRKIAFDAACKVDAVRTVDFVWALINAGAEGRNLHELGALLVSRGADSVVDDALSGRFGNLSIHDHAPDAAYDAYPRMQAQLHRLSIHDVERRLRALGALGDVPPARAGPLLATLLDDPRIVEVPALAAAVAEALLVLEPSVVWLLRGHAPALMATVAGLRSGRLVDDAAAVTAFVAAISALPVADQRRRLNEAMLPASSTSLPAEQRFALLRLTALCADAAAASAAVERLWRHDKARAVDVVLAVPDVNVVVTVDVCDGLDVDEAFDVVGPRFAVREVRDRFFASRHRRHPRVLDAALRHLVDDPVCAVAYLRENLDPRAIEEIVAAFAAAVGANAEHVVRELLLGLLTTSLGPASRQPTHSLSAMLANLAPSPWSPLIVRCLRAWRPQSGVHVTAIDAAIERINP